MTPIVRVLLCGFGLSSGLALVASGCAPCDPIPSSVFSVCHNPDAGSITPDTSFVLDGVVGVAGSACDVSVDGGAISLQVIGTPSCGPGVGADVRAVENPVKCTIPPLAAGSYTINSLPAVTFTLPLAADGGIPPCN